MNRRPRHGARCPCAACVKRRVATLTERLEEVVADGAELHPDATVPVRSYRVRAHLRRNPRHLARDPKVRAALLLVIAALLRRKR